MSERSSETISGPRADADWLNATVTIKVPVHGTAQTAAADVELTLPQLAAVLKEMAP